jgi:Fic family protein
MTTPYTPPFTITATIVSLIAEISQMVGRLSALEEVSKSLRLRRVNQVRTIQGSLAIEGNTLSIEQITAIFEGKRVIAPPREILEVRNAIKAYNQFETWTPCSRDDLLAAHNTLMSGLLDVSGQYRNGGVGVMSGEKVVHMAPPAERVPGLMSDLLHWLETTDQHPLLASSVFHYEFEFIHPFEDGNGRIGRLWQTLMLGRWNPLFVNIPVESQVYEHQQEYYVAINNSTKNGESSVFIEFMLQMIRDAISSATPEVAPEVTPEVRRLLSVLNGEMTRKDLQQKLGLLDEKHFREFYQQPAIAANLMEMTIPDKPNSRLQKYRLTLKGAAFIRAEVNRLL